MSNLKNYFLLISFLILLIITPISLAENCCENCGYLVLARFYIDSGCTTLMGAPSYACMATPVTEICHQQGFATEDSKTGDFWAAHLNTTQRCDTGTVGCIWPCQGPIDGNAILISSDENNNPIKSDRDNILVTSNTSRKCEWICKEGFRKGTGIDENKCISTPVEISSCTTLSTEGTTYLLSNDIYTSQGNCIKIKANNITLDCQGHSIIGTNIVIGGNTQNSTFLTNELINGYLSGSNMHTRYPFFRDINTTTNEIASAGVTMHKDPNPTQKEYDSSPYDNITIKNCTIQGFKPDVFGSYVSHSDGTRNFDTSAKKLSIIDSNIKSVFSYAGDGWNGLVGKGGEVIVTNSDINYITVRGMNIISDGGAGGTGGTIIANNSTINYIFAKGGFGKMGDQFYGLDNGGNGGLIELTKSKIKKIDVSGGNTYENDLTTLINYLTTSVGGTGGTVILNDCESSYEDINLIGGRNSNYINSSGEIIRKSECETICDGLDDDGDELIDEGNVCECYASPSVNPNLGNIYPANKIIPIQDKNVIAYYPFDGNSNNIKSSWNFLPLNGTVTFTSPSVKNNFNYSAYFNGEASLYLNNTTTFLDTPDYSICLWYKQEANQPMQELISGREVEQSWIGLEIQTDEYNHTIRARDTYTSPVPAKSIWQHVCYTKKGSNSKLYLNGEIVNSNNNSLNTNPFPNFILIGRDWFYYDVSGYEYFKGNIDDLIILNRELSECEVKKLVKGPNACLEDCSNTCYKKGNLPVPLHELKELFNDQNLDTYLPLNNTLINLGKGTATFTSDPSENYITGVNDFFYNSFNSNSTKYLIGTRFYSFWSTPPEKGSISLWLKTNALNSGSSNSPRIFGANNQFECFLYWGANTIQCDFGAGTPRLTSGTISIEPNKWYHLAVTWDNNSLNKQQEMWINGTLVSTTTNGKPTGGQYFFLGYSYSINDLGGINGQIFNGQIEDISLFTKKLNECEIKQIALGVNGCLPICEETICDGLDNDEDELIDEGLKSIFYLDLDKDGFGDNDNFVEACVAPENHVDTNDDCDDSNSLINPNEVEVCNNIDDDCDGLINEGLDCDVLCPNCESVEKLIKITPISTNIVDGNIVLNVNFSCNSNLSTDQGKININSVFVNTKNGSANVLFEPIIDCNNEITQRQIVISGCEQTNYLVSFGFDSNSKICNSAKDCEGLKSVLLPTNCQNNSFYWNGNDIIQNNPSQNSFVIPDNNLISVILLFVLIIALLSKKNKVFIFKNA